LHHHRLIRDRILRINAEDGVASPDPDAIRTGPLLLGRVALVTGAVGDLGSGIAMALAGNGATVFCADIRESADLARTLPDKRGRALTLDVTDSDAVDRAVSQLDDEYGRLDILVNNAGLAQRPTPLVDTPDAVVERLFDVNVKGVLYCARAAARAMIRHRSGRIINIASQAGKCGVPNWAVYCASKAAVVAATQAQALELAQHGITVNAICPGPMLTKMTRDTVRLEADATGRDSAQLLEEQGRAVPVGRYGTAADLAAMVVWIASDQSSFTTGASFNLTGGTSVFF
jgi:NAD(P)-dependent dehydrogenase (short-subunit alcohol dehydrogenase family)